MYICLRLNPSFVLYPFDLWMPCTWRLHLSIIITNHNVWIAFTVQVCMAQEWYFVKWNVCGLQSSNSFEPVPVYNVNALKL